MHAQDVANWLKSLPGIDNVRPLKLTIGNQSWYGARYQQTLSYSDSMMAVTHGDKVVGDTYTNDRIYLIGILPNAHRRRKHICFPMDGFDWYICGYYQNDPIPEHLRQYHPCGISWMLSPWDVPDKSKIDDSSPYIYKRVLMTVEYL